MSMGFSESAARIDQDTEAFALQAEPDALLRPVDRHDATRWSALESLPSAAAVLDERGVVRWVNGAWTQSAREVWAHPADAMNASYATVCRYAIGLSHGSLACVNDGVRAVLAGERAAFEHEYACHPEGSEGWYLVTVTPCAFDGARGALVQHHDVTDRRRDERRRALSRVVARAMERESPRRDMLRDLVTSACDALGWELAAVWSWDRAARVLRCDSVAPLRLNGTRAWGALTNHAGLAAQVWGNGATRWSEGVGREDAAVARTAIGAAATQLTEALGMTLGTAGRAEGVVVFYSAHSHRPDEGYLSALSTLLMGGPCAALPSARAAAEAPAESPAKRAAKHPFEALIELASASTASALLRGEGGTGKARLARDIHARGERARGAIAELRCAGLSQRAFESELFGREAGAVPGASKARRGLLEETAGGTLVLREVGALDAASQERLARFLETRTFRRVGGTRDAYSDARVIATSSQNLREAARRGAFRADLLQRLATIDAAVPPLRERAAELLDVARAALVEIARTYERPTPALTPEAERVLLGHAWPGNVRELRAVLERAWLGVGPEVSSASLVAAMAALHDTAANDVIPAQAPAAPAAVFLAAVGTAVAAPPPAALPATTSLADQERALIERVLAQTSFNMRKASQMLGISRSTLYLRARHYGLDVEGSRAAGRAARKARRRGADTSAD